MKKTLTESEHIRKMLESFDTREATNPRYIKGPGDFDPPEEIEYIELPEFQDLFKKLTTFKDDLKQLQAKVKQNPRETYKEYMAKFDSVDGKLSNFVVDVFPGNLRYEDFLVKLEDMQEQKPRKASELVSLIDQTISWFSSFEDFVEENAKEIVDHLTDNDHFIPD